MHPDDTAPNPVPFAAARGWELGPYQPSTMAEVTRAQQVAAFGKLALVIALSVIAPALAASLLLQLTGGI